MINAELLGLYRHFKGGYYYVTSVVKSCGDTIDYKGLLVNYFNICKPLDGNFVRPLSEFISDKDKEGVLIAEREDNVTGQIKRFEQVKDLNWQISSVSTEQLINELQKRNDSPIHELDIEGLQSKIFSTDYIVGIPHEGEEDIPRGVDTLAIFNDSYDAHNYLTNHYKGSRQKIFKRTFIEVD